MKLMIVLLSFFSASTAMSNEISLERALSVQSQIVISPVQYKGLPVVANSGEWDHNVPSRVCASLGYSRLVSFKKDDMSGSELISNNMEKIATVVSAGSSSEGYSRSNGSMYYQIWDISDSWWAKRSGYFVLKSVTCAK